MDLSSGTIDMATYTYHVYVYTSVENLEKPYENIDIDMGPSGGGLSQAVRHFGHECDGPRIRLLAPVESICS